MKVACIALLFAIGYETADRMIFQPTPRSIERLQEKKWRAEERMEKKRLQDLEFYQQKFPEKFK